MRTNLRASRHIFRVNTIVRGVRKPRLLYLLGGYCREGQTLVVYRDRGDCVHPTVDGVLELLDENEVRPASIKDTLSEQWGDWETFKWLRAGKQFKLRDKIWTKLAIDPLAKRVGNRIFTSKQRLRLHH